MDQENGKKWEMPEPKFRRSEGEPVIPSDGMDIDPEPDTLSPDAPDEPELETRELDLSALRPASHPPAPEQAPSVQGEAAAPAEDPLARLYDPPPGSPAASEIPDVQPAPAPPPALTVEPQPFISEQFTADKIDVKTGDTAGGTAQRPGLALAGLLILLAAAAALAGLVYFLFFAGRGAPPAN